MQFTRSFFDDGRFFLSASAVALMLAGLSVLLLGATGKLLPHDEQFLGMTAQNLCAMHECRIVHFMIHDRVSFGGSLIAIGLLYQWLTVFPLRRAQAWAWWALLISGLVGFGSFFAYLGYGYLDTWHGIATLALLPCFLLGLFQSYQMLHQPKGFLCLLRPAVQWPWISGPGFGRACLLATAAGMIVGGFTIFVVGMTSVFVPQDLAYLNVNVKELNNINDRLVPLIAHDRAGFGGGVCCCGVALFFSVWCATPSASLWRLLVLVGIIGFGTSIGVHPAIGYNDAFHLAPAFLGAGLHLIGLILTFRAMVETAHNVLIEEMP
jgi:MFS family permease